MPKLGGSGPVRRAFLVLILAAFLLSAAVGIPGVSLVVHSQSPRPSLSALALATPTIDGRISPGEWSSAATANFTFGGLVSRNATVFVMNDETNLYIAVRIRDSDFSAWALSIYFDNNNDGSFGPGENIVQYAHYDVLGQQFFGYFDGYFLGDLGITDTPNTAGGAAAVNDGNFTTVEFYHPLCDHGLHAMCFIGGQTFGFQLEYGHFNQVVSLWPQSLASLTVAVPSYYVKVPVRITSANPGTPFRAALSGCYASPRSLVANGSYQTVFAAPNCTFRATLPASYVTQYVATDGKSVISFTSCGSGLCPALSGLAYHQVAVFLSYGITGGGRPPPPTFWFSSQGAERSMTITRDSTAVWIDLAPFCSSSGLSGRSASERWVSSMNCGTPSGGEFLNFTYLHQYKVSFTARGGGRVTRSSGWYSAGAAVSVRAVPFAGHHFVKWIRSGSSISIRNANLASTIVRIGGPGSLTAVFS